MFKITHYFEWNNLPAVVGEVSKTDSGGFVLRDNTWKEANGLTILEFFNVGGELSKSEFETTFGVIGKDLPSLPETGTSTVVS